MKKLLALLLTLALLTSSVLALAEEAPQTTYFGITFSDPAATVTQDGEETEFDLTGLTLSLETLSSGEDGAFILTLGGPEDIALSATAKVENGSLILAVDGVSKALSLDLDALANEFLSSLPEEERAQLSALLEGDLNGVFDLEGMLASFQEKLTVEEYAETQEIEFLDGVQTASGMKIDMPREALDELLALIDQGTEMYDYDFDDFDDEYDDEYDDDLYEQDEDPQLDSVQMELWQAEDRLNLRADILAKMDDGSETPATLLIALTEDEQSGRFTLATGETLLLDGGFTTDEHGLTVNATFYDEDDGEAEGTLTFTAGDAQSEEGGEYDATSVTLVIAENDGETLRMELFLRDVGSAQSYSFSLFADDAAFVVGYDGAPGADANTTDGVIYLYVSDDENGSDCITMKVNVWTCSSPTDAPLPDLSEHEMVGMDELETIAEDSVAMGEVMTVLGKMMSELGKIPLLNALFTSMSAE